MINAFVKTLNNRIIDQLKTKFAIIDLKKRRIHLRHLITQIEIERKIDFFCCFCRKNRNKAYSK